MSEPSRPYDKMRDEVVEAIARNGYCKSNEARSIARELIELRKRLQAPPSLTEQYGLYP